MNEKEHTSDDCFMKVHDNLQALPDQFCHWKKESVDGRRISKNYNGLENLDRYIRWNFGGKMKI